MTGRLGYEGRPERQNEYFIPGDGISREVIQADICRYLGNDALVRPGNHNEMIADLKKDSARWEADVIRRADQGYPRGSYQQELSYSQPPSMPAASYPVSAIHEGRQQGGPSPPPAFSAPPPTQTFQVDPYAQSYQATQSPPYPPASTYTGPNHSPYGSAPNPYPSGQIPYTTSSQPPVTAEMHPSSYTYGPGYYENGRSNAPRYPGPGYETEQDYSPVTTGIPYPTTTAPDPRIGMDPRYTPEASYPPADRNRPQPARGGEAPRRTR
ncbi:transcription factor RfeG [Aspergillus luchuensis]|uniref:Transcription factor RfeG n=1 Tax=Aspergillus kawachii TaxID=1069201 RepID=A0A146F1U0_ASPKA|nr:transcription factor RfeG [Aspergillus luchuensis]